MFRVAFLICLASAAASAASENGLLTPEAVLRQDGTGFPKTWGTNHGRPVIAHYEMDQRVVTDPANLAEMMAAFRALPSILLTLEAADLFESERGIYAHPQENGEVWERPCSVGFFPTNGSAGFRVSAGVRIQGGWNRRPEESPKHSFRLIFGKNTASRS